MTKRRYDKYAKARSQGFRSNLEVQVAKQLQSQQVDYDYEEHVIHYAVPEKLSKYTPDFVLPNGIVIEVKGRFVTQDRRKHLLIKAQYPDVDVRFVFSNPHTKVGSKTPVSYGDWCTKNGFKFACEYIPQEWIEEPQNNKRIEALDKAGIRSKE